MEGTLNSVRVHRREKRTNREAPRAPPLQAGPASSVRLEKCAHLFFSSLGDDAGADTTTKVPAHLRAAKKCLRGTVPTCEVVARPLLLRHLISSSRFAAWPLGGFDGERERRLWRGSMPCGPGRIPRIIPRYELPIDVATTSFTVKGVMRHDMCTDPSVQRPQFQKFSRVLWGASEQTPLLIGWSLGVRGRHRCPLATSSFFLDGKFALLCQGCRHVVQCGIGRLGMNVSPLVCVHSERP